MFERSPISIFLLERGWGSEGRRRIQGTFQLKRFVQKKSYAFFTSGLLKVPLSLAKLVIVTIPNGLYNEVLYFNGLKDEIFFSHNKPAHKACIWTVSYELNIFSNSNN